MFEGLSVEGRRAVNLAVIAYAEATARAARGGGAGRAGAAEHAAARLRGQLRRAGGLPGADATRRRLRGELDQLQDDLADIKARSDRLRATASYRTDAETIPVHESLQAAALVLLEEYWDVYKALLR